MNVFTKTVITPYLKQLNDNEQRKKFALTFVPAIEKLVKENRMDLMSEVMDQMTMVMKVMVTDK